MTWAWRERLVAGAGVLVLAVSFLPWWTLRIGHGYGPGRETFVTYDGSAWRMSTLWSVAVAPAVLAAFVALAVHRRPARLALAAVPVLAVGLALLQLSRVEAHPLRGSVMTSTISDVGGTDEDLDAPFVAAWMARDHLRSFHDPGLTADVGWGLWVGLAAMVLVSVTIILRPGRPRTPR